MRAKTVNHFAIIITLMPERHLKLLPGKRPAAATCRGIALAKPEATGEDGSPRQKIFFVCVCLCVACRGEASREDGSAANIFIFNATIRDQLYTHFK